MSDEIQESVFARLTAANPVSASAVERLDDQRPELAALLRRGQTHPSPVEEGKETLADARSRSLRRSRARSGLAIAMAVLVAASLAAVVLTTSSPSDAAIVRRALAAVGQGQVLHVVARIEPRVKTVDLASGRSVNAYQVIEEWYEPGVGLRARLVKSNAFRSKPLPSIAQVPRAYIAALNGFTSRYEDALASGQASVTKRGSFLGKQVIWLRFHGSTQVVKGAKSTGQAYAVAIDAKTYRPLYLRQLAGGGVPMAGNEMRLLSVTSVASVPRSAPAAPAAPNVHTIAGIDVLRELSPTEASGFMSRTGLWLGSEYADLPLAKIEAVRYTYGQGEQFSDIRNSWNGLRLTYGQVDQYGKPIDGERWVMLDEQTNPIDGPGNPPLNGMLVMQSDYAGEAQVNGVYLSISARATSGPDRELLVSSARDLKPIPSSG